MSKFKIDSTILESYFEFVLLMPANQNIDDLFGWWSDSIGQYVRTVVNQAGPQNDWDAIEHTLTEMSDYLDTFFPKNYDIMHEPDENNLMYQLNYGNFRTYGELANYIKEHFEWKR